MPSSVQRSSGTRASSSRPHAEGFSAAFASPADAAAAAAQAQRELASADAIPFAVRMAIHTGEAGDRDGSYGGAEVNRTGRLMALAHGGQVLVSDTAEVLLRSRATLRPLGEHLLRGHRGRISVFQLVADGLTADFPVLRSAEHFAGNLPRQVSSLVGRDAEVGRRRRTGTGAPAGHADAASAESARPAWPSRSALNSPANSRTESGSSSWRGSLTRRRFRLRSRRCLGITPQSDVPLIDTVAETVAGRRMLVIVDNCEHVRARGGDGSRGDPRQGRQCPGAGHVTRGPRSRRRGGGHRAAADHRRRHDIRCCHAFRRAGPHGPPQLRALGSAHRAGGDRDLRDGRRAAARHRTGGGAHGGDERDRGPRPADRSFPPAAQRFSRPRTPAHAAPRRRLVLRPADRGRAGAATKRVGLRSAASTCRRICAVADECRRHRRSSPPRLARPQVARGGRSLGDDDPLQPLRDDPAVRGGPPCGSRGAGAHSRRSCRRVRAAARPRNGSGGTARGGARPSTGSSSSSSNLRAGLRWSSERGRLDVATDIAAHAALMGFSVQLFETLAWAEELLDAASKADVAACPGSTRPPVTRASSGGPTLLAKTPTAQPNWRPTIATTRASRATPRSSKRSARSTAATSTATSSSPAEVAERYGSERGYALASYVDGLQSAGRVEEALAITEQSVEVARRLGNPYWISYALWIAGMAFSKADSRRALGRLGRRASPSSASIGSGSSRASSRATRPACTPPTASRRRRWCSSARRSRRSIGPATSRSSIITLASVPALFERLERFEPAATLLGAMSQQPSSFHHVPELADLETATRPESSMPSGSANSSPPGAPSTSTMRPSTRGSRSTPPAATRAPSRASRVPVA